ncbi:MAG TPA: PIG-L family deacetylase [Bryobacteraceae bacterium]|jgi:LmbE family N-acetylglucosaminyl deacetylase|nr:PIG-L family deacetylase [Bryobacteraceae bacterium]
MDRRDFFGAAVLAGATPLAAQNIAGPATLTIERPAEGTPHQGKVLALITPHLDDGPIFAFGTIAKLLREGYTGYLIRTSNDEKDSYEMTLGETVLANERDARALAKATGLKNVFDLGYRNHRMDDVSRIEIRARLIFLFRLLKVDTIFSYDPWDHYEENPDHYVTAQSVEAACWMAGGAKDFPEHFEAGLKPHSVTEKYYFARGPQQLVNRVVDIGPTMEAKRVAIRGCRTMLLHMVKDVNASLTARKLKIPEFSGTDDQAIDAYIKAVFEPRDAATGRKHDLTYAEEFHYIAPDPSMEEYISRHAVSL